MDRRQFIRNTGLFAAGIPLFISGQSFGQEKSKVNSSNNKSLSRMSVTSVCFREWFSRTPPPAGVVPDRKMTLLEFPKFVAQEFQLPAVEMWAAHFDEPSMDYCHRLQKAASDAGIRYNNIQLDLIDYDLAATTPGDRERSISTVMQWMDRAVACGATSVRANTDKPIPDRPFDPVLIADSFRQIAEYGEKVGIQLLIENHSGYSKSIDNVIQVYDRIKNPNCKTLADWGNSDGSSTAERIQDIQKMFPGLGFVSAKGLRFDDNYKHIDYDIGEITRATEQSGYNGVYSVELYYPDRAQMPKDPIRAVHAMIAEIAPNLRTG